MQIIKEIYYRMIDCPMVPPETGGILGIKKSIVCTYTFDGDNAVNDKAEYMPNVEVLNKQISAWADEGIVFGGIAHSHPPRQLELSCVDKCTINKIFDAMPNYITKLYFPIIIPKTEIMSYKAIRVNNTVEILNDIVTIIG